MGHLSLQLPVVILVEELPVSNSSFETLELVFNVAWRCGVSGGVAVEVLRWRASGRLDRQTDAYPDQGPGCSE